ncbi:S8 family serine peptidase [Thauera sp. JM12B12]|uniref:S8 family serine peptidase n=1 Tax=Thauera sp. JM12B12 TaxID=3142262 RepID=UPI0031F38BAD
MNTSASLRKPVLASLVVALGAAFIPAQAVAAEEAQWVPGRLLVQPRAGLSEAEFDKIIKPHGGKQVGKIEGINVRVIQLPPQASEKAVEALLKNNKHLKFAERDRIVPQDTTNDPYFGNAWHLPKIGAPTAWATGTGAGVTIAILDSGIDSKHPDLAGKVLPGWNFYDGNSDLTDVTGHGTQVAGTAAAASNNATGVASIAGGAMILPGRIASTTGSASFSTMAKGVTWAADQGARLANISYGGARSSSTVQSAGQYLKSKGGLLVVSGGNSGAEEIIAASDALIAVSGTTSTDAKASWSSFGSYIDVAAPGAGIWTTNRGGGYGSISGTSIASPATAGVLALMMEANPKLGPDDLTKLLFSTAVDLGTAGYDKYFGHGRVNAAAAVQAAATATVSDTSAPTVSVSGLAAGATVSGLVAVGVSATDNVGVSRVELLVNGSLLATDISSPYGFSWDSTKTPDGTATLTARAYDAAGNFTAKSLSVTVANSSAKTTAADTVAPVAAITNPVGGGRVNGTVSVNGSASDDVRVTQMRLYIDAKLVSTVTGNSLSYRWNTKKVAAGTHTITLDAFDAAGNRGTRSITVTR